MADNREISPKDVESLTGKSAATAWRYMKKLVEAGIVVPMGNTNNMVYRLNEMYVIDRN